MSYINMQVGETVKRHTIPCHPSKRGDEPLYNVAPHVIPHAR